MKLYEMFSPIGAPKENDDIDWLGDLKFFIDNDNAVLNRLIFPTIVKHERCVEEKDAYKLYYKPIKECLKIYIKKYDIVDADKKFSTGQLVELCKNIAEEQKRHIQNGDYKNESVYEDIHKGKERFLSSTKISESYEIAESVSVDAAIRSIVATGDSIAKTYGDLKTMAEKWVYNNGTLKGFHRNAAGVGKRWYDTFFWNKMENDLRTLLKTNPNAAAKIQDFLNIERDDRGHVSFTVIGRSLPKILKDVGQRMGNDDLKRFGANWFRRQQDYEEFLSRVESEVNDEDDDEAGSSPKQPNDNIIGRQNAAVEDMVNQILSSIDKKIAGEIRNSIAKDSNKLQALQRELARRNIKLGESLAEVFDMFGPVSNLEMAVTLLAVLSMPLAIIGPEVFDRIKNKIQKMSSRRIINLLSQKQIKADTATKKMIERLLYELQQSFDRNDGDQAKQIALRIQQIAKDTEDKKSVAAETIDTVKGGYKLVSEKTGDNLSTYPTRTGAVEAERRIQIFKSRDK
jgi:hypothetical protein